MSGLFNDDTLSLYLKLKEAMKQYVKDVMPGGLLNREVPNYVGLLADHAKAQQDTLRNAWGDPNAMADATLGMMQSGLGSFAPMGITVWHGSPHKFAPTAKNPLGEFDLSKIGTGEGAQAYGHGVYVAESPEVAKDYQKVLSGPVNKIAKGQGKYYHITDAGSGEVSIAGYGSSQDQWGRSSNLSDFWDGADEGFKSVDDAVAWLRKNGHIDETAQPNKVANAEFNEWQIPSSGGSLYKVDLPDEYLPRMLDWDKPLSQQTAEVISALERSKNKNIRSMLEYAKVPYPDAIGGEAKTMGEAFRLLNLNLQGKASANSPKASTLLSKQGIPGIRYLDGGSRGAGTGTNNYVIFSPEILKILERQ